MYCGRVERWILFGLLLVAVGISVPATAKEGGDRRADSGPQRPDPDGFIARHADELGIDAETREVMQAIADASRKRAEALRLEARELQREFRRLLSEASPDETAVLAQSDRLEAIRAEERRNRLKAMLEIRKLLTLEQRQRLVELRDEDAPHGPGRGQLRSLCREDVATLCAETPTGRDRLRCLDSNWEQLSEGCREAFGKTGWRRVRRDIRPEPPAD